MFATRKKCIASSNKCLTSSNKKLLISNKCHASSNRCLTSSNKKPIGTSPITGIVSSPWLLGLPVFHFSPGKDKKVKRPALDIKHLLFAQACGWL